MGKSLKLLHDTSTLVLIQKGRLQSGLFCWGKVDWIYLEVRITEVLMRRLLAFKQIIYDTQSIAGQTSVDFFVESDKNDKSITVMTEDQAVKWLFETESFRQLFIESFFDGGKNVKYYFGVTVPFTTKNKKPGDIDLLLVDPNRPDKAIAFECKRVKAVSQDESLSKVNSIEKIRYGVKQANQYQSLGFHQSYLMVILLDDGRQFKGANTFFRNTSRKQLENMYDIPWQEPLNEDVGIAYVRANQPTGRDYNLAGSLGLCIDKKAGALEQTTAMTNKIEKFIANYHAH
ncbi:MAG: hypothetical protein ACKVOR_13600 [Flavobacteriales bacterium]